jgi:2-iminobutanoate/2-iminopropanoate deaminase
VRAAGALVFVSGQGPLRDGKIIEGSVAEQTRLTMNNVGSVLAAAGLGFSDIVRCNVYLADIADFAQMDAAYSEFFDAVPPARTTVGAALDGIAVEIDCIAVESEPQR